MTELSQEIDRLRRDTPIRQKPHVSGAEIVQFVLSEGRGVCECLANIFFLEIRQFLDNLHRCHAIRDEVDDVRHGNPKAADRGSPGQNIWILRDAIERACHNIPPAYSS